MLVVLSVDRIAPARAGADAKAKASVRMPAYCRHYV